MAYLTNAEAIYDFREETHRPVAVQHIADYVGHWLYANGRELLDFRADQHALFRLKEGQDAKDLRMIVGQRLFLYNRVKNYTLFCNPLTQRADVQKGRKVRGCPPSDFLDYVSFPFGEKLVDLIKSNKTARLVSLPGKAGEPIVFRFQHPFNDYIEYEIALMPSMGYVPVKRIISIDQGHRTMTFDITPTLANGVWFPVQASYEDKYSDGRINTHIDWICTDIHVNDPSFDLSRLRVKLPKGTSLTDSIAERSVVLQSDEEAESFIEPLKK
jgi:hypothetical protein